MEATIKLYKVALYQTSFISWPSYAPLMRNGLGNHAHLESCTSGMSPGHGMCDTFNIIVPSYIFNGYYSLLQCSFNIIVPSYVCMSHIPHVKLYLGRAHFAIARVSNSLNVFPTSKQDTSLLLLLFHFSKSKSWPYCGKHGYNIIDPSTTLCDV